MTTRRTKRHGAWVPHHCQPPSVRWHSSLAAAQSGTGPLAYPRRKRGAGGLSARSGLGEFPREGSSTGGGGPRVEVFDGPRRVWGRDGGSDPRRTVHRRLLGTPSHAKHPRGVPSLDSRVSRETPHAVVPRDLDLGSPPRLIYCPHHRLSAAHGTKQSHPSERR